MKVLSPTQGIPSQVKDLAVFPNTQKLMNRVKVSEETVKYV